jgi:hypothetical protein
LLQKTKPQKRFTPFATMMTTEISTNRTGMQNVLGLIQSGFQYNMMGSLRRTLIRYFLLLALTKRGLPGSIIKASGTGKLILLIGAFKRFSSGLMTTTASTITIAPITRGANEDLGMTATTMI